tara:strand:+ start:500 stop:739 length:240 start_codon:yes stop_codon:yes gene_type:complete
MSRVLNEITIINGQYLNKNGESKNRYQTIGSIIETKNGPMLKLDFIPLLNDWNGWAYINEPRQQNELKQRRNEDDDLPF